MKAAFDKLNELSHVRAIGRGLVIPGTFLADKNILSHKGGRMEERQKEHWLKEIEIKDLLSKDAELVYDFCGLDVLISLWEALPSITLYLSLQPLAAAQKRYIAFHYDGHNLKQLAAKLKCSDTFVYDVIRGKMSDYLPKKDRQKV